MASRRKACHTPSSLRKLVAVSMWQARRRFSCPQCGSRNGCHEQCCALTLAARAAHAIPAPAPACHTALRADNHERPCGRPCRSVPPASLVAAARHPDRYGLRRFACRSGVSSASAPARRVAASLRAGCARRRFHVPSVAAAACGRAPATTPGAGVAAGTPGRGLCAWIHAPARTPAVLTGCHTPRPHDSKFTIAQSINGVCRAS